MGGKPTHDLTVNLSCKQSGQVPITERLGGRAGTHPPSQETGAARAAELRGDTPLESVFGAASPEVPVVCVDEDLRLQEARAFAAGAGEDFPVKARLEVGDAAEHIWIAVESIAGTVVRGQLGNNPVNLDGLSMGSPVKVEASAIEDWVFRRDGEPEGLFSVPVLMAMRAERAGATSSLIH